MSTCLARIISSVFILACSLACFNIAVAEDEHVYITHDLPDVEVLHNGKPVRIQRNPDTLNIIDSEYVLTSRPCPPFCIQPMVLAPGVDTIGELELIDYLRAISAGDQSVMVVDSRTEDWTRRTGIIPGAHHVCAQTRTEGGSP